LLAQGRSGILLDFVQVDFIDSQGIGALARTWVSVRGKKLKLCGLTPRVKEVLGITGLLKIMDCFDDLGAALRGFSQDS